MADFSDKALQSMEELLDICDHILEEDLSDHTINKMRDRIVFLQKQSEDYSNYLTDQENNSRSSLSREMASLLLEEDKEIRNCLGKVFPDTKCRMRVFGINTDENMGALCVEYLTGRARQSIRDALISAMKLRILSEDTEVVNILSENNNYNSGRA